MRLAALLALLLVLPAATSSGARAPHDWPLFGYDSARHGVSPETTLDARTVSKLQRLQVQLDGTVDSSPIYVGGKVVVTKKTSCVALPIRTPWR